MNAIAATLRKLAQTIPRGKDDQRSPFICDYLHRWDSTDNEKLAHAFLHKLGMGRGIHVFNISPTPHTHIPRAHFENCQSRRIAWLLFAADIAEEWNA